MNKENNVTGAFVGLATLDYIYYTTKYPENNTKVKTNDYRRYVGGPAANAAITYALLGGNAVLVTCLGGSSEAGVISEILKSYGVTVINCAKDKGLPNIASIMVDEGGNRTIFSGQNRFREIDLDFDITPDFCLFDLNQQEISLELLTRMECPVILDAGSWKDNTERFLAKADTVISSETFRGPLGQTIFEMDDLSGKELAITRGEKDILLKDSFIAVGKTTCVDTLGAGDIFHGAYCYARYELQKSFSEALRFAGQIATESVKYQGPREWAKHREKGEGK